MYQFFTDVEKSQYEDFVSSNQLNSLLQSYNWKDIKDNWKPFYTAVKDQNDEIVAAGLVLNRVIKGVISFAYIPRGPILDYRNKELLSFYFENLKKFAKEKKWDFVKLDPKVVIRSAQINEFSSADDIDEAWEIIENLKALGLKWHGRTIEMDDTFQPRFDATTYLTDDIRKQLSSATKQKINRAVKKNVSIRKSDGSKDELVKFQDILKKTIERKNISLRDVDYFEKMVKAYPDNFRLSFAELNISETKDVLNERIREIDKKIEELKNKNAHRKLKELEQNKVAIERSIGELPDGEDLDTITLAGMMSVGYGDTLEMLYAGFDVRYKTYFPQYLLYLRTMEEAYENGLKKACMGGIPGTLDDGLLEFKRHFAPKIEEYIGEFDLITSPLYRTIDLLFKLRKALRRLRK